MPTTKPIAPPSRRKPNAGQDNTWSNPLVADSIIAPARDRSVPRGKAVGATGRRGPNTRARRPGQHEGEGPPLARLDLEVEEDERRDRHGQAEEPARQQETEYPREDMDRSPSRDDGIDLCRELNVCRRAVSGFDRRGRGGVLPGAPQVRHETEGGQHEHGNADHPGIELRLHGPVLCPPDHDGKEQEDQETEDGLRANPHGSPNSSVLTRSTEKRA